MYVCDVSVKICRMGLPVQVCIVTEMCKWVEKEQPWLWRQTEES